MLNYIPMILGRTLKGSNFGGVKIHSDIPKIVERCINKVIYNFMFSIMGCEIIVLLFEQEINLGDLITHEISLADINKGLFEYMKQPDCVKVIIKF